MIRLFTIGFAGKSAENFFNLLVDNGVKNIIDTRRHPSSQLSGFAKAKDLEFFAKRIGNIAYEHRMEFAPTEELLSMYRSNKITWAQYETEYLDLLAKRGIPDKEKPASFNEGCLLCSEHNPSHCHRRLLAEYLAKHFHDLTVIHLM